MRHGMASFKAASYIKPALTGDLSFTIIRIRSVTIFRPAEPGIGRIAEVSVYMPRRRSRSKTRGSEKQKPSEEKRLPAWRQQMKGEAKWKTACVLIAVQTAKAARQKRIVRVA